MATAFFSMKDLDVGDRRLEQIIEDPPQYRDMPTAYGQAPLHTEFYEQTPEGTPPGPGTPPSGMYVQGPMSPPGGRGVFGDATGTPST